MREEQMHHEPLARPELTLAAEIERGEPRPRGIEIDVNLIANAVVAKVEIEFSTSPLVPVEDVSEHDYGSPSVCAPVPTKRERSGTFPPAVVYRHRRFGRRRYVAALHAQCIVDLAETGVLAADDLDEAVQQLGCERRRSVDHLRFLQEGKNPLGISCAKPRHCRRQELQGCLELRSAQAFTP